MRNALFWVALPFLLPQALWVRHHAVRFRDADGPTAGVCGIGEELRLVAVGDSIIAGVGASTLEKALVGQTAKRLSSLTGHRVHWSAYGRTGFNSSRILVELLPLFTDHPADVYLVSLGVNDVTSLTSLRRWENNLTELIEYLSTTAPRPVLAFVGLPPMHVFPALPQPLRALIGIRARSVDQRLQDVCSRYPAALHIPVEFDADPDNFAGDGYHPSEASYAVFAAAVATRINIRLADCSSSRLGAPET